MAPMSRSTWPRPHRTAEATPFSCCCRPKGRRSARSARSTFAGVRPGMRVPGPSWSHRRPVPAQSVLCRQLRPGCGLRCPVHTAADGRRVDAALYVIFASIGLIETLADSSAFAVLPQAVAADGLDKANSQIAATQIILDEFVGLPVGS